MLKSAITTLLLASSSVAMADTPYPPSKDARNDDLTDRRGTQLRNRRPVVLAQNVVVNPRDNSPEWIPIHGRYGVSRVKLQLQRGGTFIENIVVVYADGRREMVRVGQRLSASSPQITIKLARRGMQGIFIDAAPNRFARGGGYRRNQIAVVNVIGIRR